MDVKARNHIRKSGHGKKTMVFAHGFGANQEMWRNITPAFQENYQVVTFDYVGSGKSDMNAYNSVKYSSLHGYKQDLLEVVESLDTSPVILVAHSVSSMIGMLAAIEHPERFSSLIMVGPSPRYINDGDYIGGFETSDVDELLAMMEMNFLGWASYLAPIAIHQENDGNLVEELQKSFTSTDIQVMKDFAKATFYSDHRNALQELQTPTYILQCSEDSIVPEQVGEYLAKNIPNATYAKMDAKGHYPHLSHPQQTIALIQQYLEAVNA